MTVLIQRLSAFKKIKIVTHLWVSFQLRDNIN